MQSSIQRVAGMIRDGSCDRIPRGEITIDDAVVANGLQCRVVGFEERLEFCSFLGLDIYCLAPLPSSSESLPQPGELFWPDLNEWVENSGLFTFGVLDGPFGWGIRIFGFERFLTMTIKDPESLQKFNSDVERLNRELSIRLAERGIMGLILADDIAHGSGLFVSPHLMLQHFLPSLSRQTEHILSLGLPLFFHSDGDFMRILPQVSAIGFHGFHCIDPDSRMDLAEVRATVGSGCCLWGTLTAREVTQCLDYHAQEALLCKVRGAASSGGFILGTTSGLFKGLQVEVLKSIYSRI